MSATIINDIRKLVAGEQVDPETYDILYKYGCLNVLERNNSEYYKKVVAKHRRLNYLQSKIRLECCCRIFQELNLRDINYAVVKGAVLSETIYGDLSYRYSADLDILISPNNIDVIKQLLLDDGFIQGKLKDNILIPFSREEQIFQASSTHQIAPFVKYSGKYICPIVNIDVNFDILWGENSHRANMESFLLHSHKHRIIDVEIKKLDIEAEFISMCLHHYKDMNSIYMILRKNNKLSLFFDIYYFILNNEMNIESLMNLIEELKVSKYIYYCLYYTDLIFCSAKIKFLMSQMRKDGFEKIKNTFGLSDKERKTWPIDFFERLFCEDLNQKIGAILTESDKMKVRYNWKNM